MTKMLLESEKKTLQEGLNFLHVGELKIIAAQLKLPDVGPKGPLVARILHFLQTGELLTPPKIPAVSRAKRGHTYPLAPETLCLKGAYKNDLATRLFFQKLVGPQFHFTAFGVDWMTDRWLKGKPPTYQEFAEMWQAEYTRRQTAPATPKKEWAYINFTQRFLKAHPTAPRAALTQAWEAERQTQKERVLEVLKSWIS